MTLPYGTFTDSRRLTCLISAGKSSCLLMWPLTEVKPLSIMAWMHYRLNLDLRDYRFLESLVINLTTWVICLLGNTSILFKTSLSKSYSPINNYQYKILLRPIYIKVPWKKLTIDRKFAQRKLLQSFPVYTIKVWSKFDQSFYRKLPFGHHFLNSCSFVYIYLDSKDVLIDHFPSKSVKVFRKIGLVFILQKSDSLRLFRIVYT